MQRKRQSILGAKIDAVSWDNAMDTILAWAQRREHRYVCICNVHSVVSAANDAAFMTVVNSADLSTPDGAPIAWALRRLGYPGQERINGPDLMWRYLHEAALRGQSVYFYGSTAVTLTKLREAVSAQFPALRIAGSLAPSFHAATDKEDQSEVDAINRAEPNLVFVGLGCPKQEMWMAAHCGRINAVMIGVGAAFDYHSGMVKRAPLWFQRNGLEWLYRLWSEPRRLFKRYLVTNAVFIIRIAGQLVRHGLRRTPL